MKKLFRLFCLISTLAIRNHIQAMDINKQLREHACLGTLLEVRAALDRGADLEGADEFGRTALSLAASKGRSEIVEILLNAGARCSSVDRLQSTPLRYAVGGGYLEVVKLLLGRGADVGAVDLLDRAVLYDAVLGDNIELVRLLLLNNATVTVADRHGQTPLHIALGNKKYAIEIMRILLDGGANVNARDKQGLTSLHEAVKANKVTIINLLLDYEATIDARNNVGLTPLHYAMDSEKITPAVATLLLKRGADANVHAQESGRTPLHVAVLCRNKQGVMILLDAGANSNAIDNDGQTPLQLAAFKGNEGIVRLLLERGAQVGTINENNIPACNADNKQDCRYELLGIFLLLKAGAPIEVTDADSMIERFFHPLAKHSMCDDRECIKAELKSEQFVKKTKKVQRKEVLEALALAVAQAHKETTLLLLDYTIENTLLNRRVYSELLEQLYYLLVQNLPEEKRKKYRELQTALQERVQEKTDPSPIKFLAVLKVQFPPKVALEIIKYRLLTDQTPYRELLEAVFTNSLVGIEAALKNRVTINERDLNGFTVLHYAALGSNKDTIDLLLSYGARRTAQNNEGYTPAMLARKIKRDEVLVRSVMTPQQLLFLGAYNGACELIKKQVLEHKVSVNSRARNFGNVTPLLIACRQGNVKSVKVLLDLGADIEVKDSYGKTVVHYAVANGNTVLVNYLKEQGADITIQDNYGMTPLHYAVQAGNKAMVLLLLYLGSYPRALSNDNNSLLMRALIPISTQIVSTIEPNFNSYSGLSAGLLFSSQ